MKNDLTTWIEKSFLYKKIFHKVEVVPFIKKIELKSSHTYEKKYDFIYVADSLPHKNHRLLLKAWELSAKDGLFPTLALTLDPKLSPPSLMEEIARLNNLGVKVINLGTLTRDGLMKSYLESSALIYPSLAESFGIPLIEAAQLRIPIVASELDYVYDVCSPVLTFDPNSANSLARTIKKFLNFNLSVREIATPSEFLNFIYE
jgi:glycosyltransferase involved in cell wall biosynthesis